MKSFKTFISKYLKKDKDGRIIVDTPIHYKNTEQDDSKTEYIKESEKYTYQSVIDKNYDHGTPDQLSRKLFKHLEGGPTERQQIKDYTKFNKNGVNASKRLNKKLASGASSDNLHQDDKRIHDAIMNNAHPSGHEYHALSGTSRDFAKMSKEGKTDKFHFPAHTSTTHDPDIAEKFAIGKRNEDDEKSKIHMMHIHVKPHNKIMHTAPYSEFPEEHETVIPSGTNMKYHGTSKHKDEDGNHWHTHHFTIED